VITGRGRKPSISDEKVAEIVDLAVHANLRVRRIGHVGRWPRGWVSSASVARICSARRLKPHLMGVHQPGREMRQGGVPQPPVGEHLFHQVRV
jgi:hypothetical protein